VFERFAERTRQVVVLALDEARLLGHNYIGTEHLLLGLLLEEEGVAARILAELEVTVEEVRAQVVRLVGRGERAAAGQIPFTPRAKRVLELSLREATALNHESIGTEHVLLGLAREDESTAMQILRDFDVDSERIQTDVMRALAVRRRPAGPPPREPSSDPDELEQIGRRKEEALEDMEFERAAYLRERERELLGRRGREYASTGLVRIDPPPRPLVAALVVAALGFPLGVLAGWLASRARLRAPGRQ
jgi:ATP-dependent Clp protease ATP-binding subunit ClpA